MAPGLQRQEPGRSGPSDFYHIVLVTFLVTVTKYLSRKQIRGRRISLGLLRGYSPSWLSRHGRVHGVILCDKTPLQSRKQRAKARMGQPILNKAHSPMTHFLQQGFKVPQSPQSAPSPGDHVFKRMSMMRIFHICSAVYLYPCMLES